MPFILTPFIGAQVATAAFAAAAEQAKNQTATPEAHQANISALHALFFGPKH